MTTLGLFLLVAVIVLAGAVAFLLFMVQNYRIDLRETQAHRDQLLADGAGDSYWTAFDRERGRWAADPELES